jgi:predicted nucleotidyltransferase
MTDLKEKIIIASGLHKYKIQNIYLFGSRVYSNNSDTSDWDVLIIAKTSEIEKEIKGDLFNIHIMTKDRFEDGLKQHNIRNIECLMAPDWAILQEDIKFNFKIKLDSLRHSISHMNALSYVKCKKKLAQDEYYIGIKSIWHSMRMVLFGIQIVTHGKIIDWKCANHLWDEIISKDWTWDELNNRFKKYNSGLMTEFRKIAPKNDLSS